MKSIVHACKEDPFWSIVMLLREVPTNEKFRKLSSPPHLLFLSAANKAPEEREIKGVGANPAILTFSIFYL